MKTGLIGAALLGALTASASQAALNGSGYPAAAPETLHGEEGGAGSRSVKLASAVTSTFLVPPDVRQSPLVTVSEGGEGRRGRRARRGRDNRDFDGFRNEQAFMARRFRAERARAERAREVRRLREERVLEARRFREERARDERVREVRRLREERARDFDRPRAGEPSNDPQRFGPRFF